MSLWTSPTFYGITYHQHVDIDFSSYLAQNKWSQQRKNQTMFLKMGVHIMNG